jgi:hypothetical protein
MLGETSLAPAAAAVLGAAIETLDASATVLTSKGFAWQTAAYLVAVVKSGEVDIEDLRANGIDAKTAIAICEAISKRHERKRAALAAVRPMAQPVLPPLGSSRGMPKPLAAPVETREETRLAALSLLHDLALALESGDAAGLRLAGFSAGTAKELTDLINAAHGRG